MWFPLSCIARWKGRSSILLIGVGLTTTSYYLNITGPGGSIARWLGSLLLDPAAPGFIPSIPKKMSLMLLSLINGAG